MSTCCRRGALDQHRKVEDTKLLQSWLTFVSIALEVGIKDPACDMSDLLLSVCGLHLLVVEVLSY